MWCKFSLDGSLIHLRAVQLSSPILSSNLLPQQNNRKSTESIISCLALGTSRVLWQEDPAGIHTDACLHVSLALQSQIILEMIVGSKVGKQEPAPGEAS